jgi:hypothetical protein
MGESPSMRIFSRGPLTPRLAILVMFAVLLPAATAQASQPSAPLDATETPIQEAAPESGALAEETPPAAEAAPPAEAPPAEGSSAAEAASPVAEEAPSSAEEAPPAAEAPPAEAAPPPAEETSPPAQEAPPPTQELPPVAEAAPPEVAPPAEEAPPVAEAPVIEEALGQTVGSSVGEAASKTASEDLAPEEAGAGPQASAVPSPEGTGGEAAPEVSPALAPMPTSGYLSAISMSSTQSPLGGPDRQASARRLGLLGFGLAALVGPIAANCAGGWLDIATARSASSNPFAAPRLSLTAIAADASTRHVGGSAVENHPTSPTPGSGSGGVGGGSAGCGSGSAASACFTLAGLLLQAAPSAMRRLRLSRPSWRTSFFVLIPERPD